jgi:hypothetical protein
LRAKILIGLLLISFIIGGNQPILLHLESEAELKPLEINGPTLAEVNETISLIVTSEGLPVKGAIVSFAGYEKETNENGIATFQIDFAGSFKAIVRKDGYKVNSTLLWIFPKGSEKFLIRSTKSMTDPQLFGDFDSAGRMAGFNYARIKAYYTYDCKGNVYPIILTLGKAERLSDEATEAIKENYEGETPRYNLWIRVPHEVYFKNLEWMISRARSWGLKIFLLAEVLPRVEEEHIEGAPPITLDNKAFERFLDQRRSEALMLTEFAERHNVELLDPLGPFWFPEEPKDAPLRQLSLYRELLSDIRSRFHGKLAVWMIGRISDVIKGIGLKEYNYSGFDYLVPWFGCGGARLTTDSPSKWEEAVHRFLDFTEYLKEKYNVSILVGYIASFEYNKENDKLFNKFMSYFNNSYEDARTWFMKLIFDEILRRGIRNADAHPLWFFEMQSSIPGLGANEEAYRKFSYWPSRRSLNLVSEYFSQPWNNMGRNALNILQHAKIVANSIIAKSHNVNLVDWLLETLKRSSKAYETSMYKVAINEAQKILGFSCHLENPLNISIDGKADDWKSIDPVYFNPSRAFPWFNLVWCYSNDSRVGREVREMGNLRSVYAINDKENLYLMLDFYGKPPNHLPNIAIDISGNWTHEFGKEFHIPLHDGLTEIWKVAYVGNDFDPQGFGSEKVGICEVKVRDAVEVKIPLKILGNPRKVNLIVWYPWNAPWGDMEVDLVDWSVPSLGSSIFISTSSNKLLLEENVVISGFIYPAHPNSKVTLTYTMPNGTILTRNVTTKALGEFEDIVTLNIAGNWTVRASWSGDYDHEGAKSIEISFSVLKGKSSLSLLVSKDNIKEDEQIIISGSINPPLAKAEITLTFEMPTGLTFTKAVLTDSDGSFSYALIPKDVGIWKLHASWPGNDNYEGASSPALLFTVIALKPTEFIFTNLTITPMQAEVGQTITISVKVTNVGEQTGTYNVDLKLNGTIVNSKIVSLRGEESTIVMFKLVKEEAGTFNVEISGLKGTFIVKELSLPLWQEYWYLIVGITIISIAFFLFLRIRVKYRKV